MMAAAEAEAIAVTLANFVVRTTQLATSCTLMKMKHLSNEK